VSFSDDYAFRFGGMGRLIGKPMLEKLRSSHVCVIGVGGVGGWAAEALVRSGVGEISLVDFDEVCLSNTNRQIQALSDEVGKLKVQVLANRFRLVNPEIKINILDFAFIPDSVEAVLGGNLDVVIDAIDRASNKCLLITECKNRGIPLVVTGAAGGRRNPSLIKISDITEVQEDPLLARVRRILRQKHGFPRATNQKFGLTVVASSERPTLPQEDACELSQDPFESDQMDHNNNQATLPTQDNQYNQNTQVGHDTQGSRSGRLDCRTGYGTASFVTGVFGFYTASAAIECLINKSVK
jgi:tRNA A37 threonylcarbamoyladenosine dehydratase